MSAIRERVPRQGLRDSQLSCVQRHSPDDSHLSSSDESSALPSSFTQGSSSPGARNFVQPRVWTPAAASDSFSSPVRSLFDERTPRIFSRPVKGRSPVRPDDPWASTQLWLRLSSLQWLSSLLSPPSPLSAAFPLPTEHERASTGSTKRSGNDARRRKCTLCNVRRPQSMSACSRSVSGSPAAS